MPYPFRIVDVFAQERYAGNQLAVVLDAQEMPSDRMQAIAREFNFAETSFVASPSLVNGGHPVRIFTPKEELPFAGHPALGTAWVLRRAYGTARDRNLVLNLPVGQVTVSFDANEIHGIAWLEAPPAEFAEQVDKALVATALGLDVEDFDPELPVQQVKMGLSVLVVPLATRDALERARLDLKAFEPIQKLGVPPFVHLFCAEPLDSGNDLCARFYFDAGDTGGVREDSATGSASACLGAYLLRNGYRDSSPLALRIEQGHLVGRPSLIMVEADGAANAPMVSVGGRVVEVARGELS